MYRNLLTIGGLSILSATLIDIHFAGLPASLVMVAMILIPQSSDPWSVYGLVFAEVAPAAQVVVAGTVFLAGFVVGVWDPRSPGDLRSRR